MSAPDFATCDLLDNNEGKPELALRVVEPMFKAFGAHARFCGQIETLKVFEDNTLVREALASPERYRPLRAAARRACRVRTCNRWPPRWWWC